MPWKECPDCGREFFTKTRAKTAQGLAQLQDALAQFEPDGTRD